MRFYLLLIPTVLIACFIFFAMGLLGTCIMTSCLNPDNTGTANRLLGAAIMLVAAVPLVTSLAVLITHLRKRRLGSVARALTWSVVVIIGAVGLYQIVTDPGDAMWAGVPMLVFSVLLAFSVRHMPQP